MVHRLVRQMGRAVIERQPEVADQSVVAVTADLQRDDRVDPLALEKIRLGHVLANDVVQDRWIRRHPGQDLARATMGLVPVAARERF